MKDKISIIVPVYNVERYINQCINSIINQTYTNIEIILVNDGSTDNSGQICNEFARKDNRIIVINKKNGGLSSARNVGLDIATGDYIGFVDSDDWVHKDMYKNLIKVAKLEQSDIIECKFENVYDRNEKQIDNLDLNINTFSNIEALSYHLNGNYFYRCVWNKIYKKHLFKQIRFPEGKVAEDLFVSHELFFKAKLVSHVNFVGYNYYIRPDGIMGKRSFNLIKDTFEGMREQHSFICKNIPQLKPFIDKLYINCLLKSYANFSIFNLNEKDLEYYLNLINDELNRDDISVNGISKYAYKMYKISPEIFSIIINFIYRKSHG